MIQGFASERASNVAGWLRERMQSGVLAFPLTAFTEDGRDLNLEAFRAHIRRHISAGAGAIFVCCGTGEFSALNEEEYRVLVSTAVNEAKGELPVIAGTGYGWALASQFAEIAQEAGADALLLLPHYLVSASQEGLVGQVEAVASSTDLPIILYQRGLVSYTTSTVAALAKIPTVIGLKDGQGDYVELQRMTLTTDEDFLYFNGALTAELQYRPYQSVGISAYSSAVHSCVPEVASAFFSALRSDDSETVDRMLSEFYSPLVSLRDRVPGYAVSLIKTTARLRGEAVGPVRAPLVDPTGDDLVELTRLMRHGLSLVGAEF